MKKTKLAASLIAVSMAATTLLTGCNNNPATSDTPSGGSSSSSGSNSSTPSSSGGSESSDPGTSAPVNNPSFAENLPFNLKYADNTKIRIAAGYNSNKTGIEFDAEVVGEGIDLSDGKHYTPGMLKPTWETLRSVLKVTFENKYQNNSASDEFKYWQSQLDQVDIVCGTAKQINEMGSQGAIVDLSKYLDQMPNFKKYLDDNAIVRMSITGYKTAAEGGELGAIYFAPYFDGVNDIERMPLMRTDMVEKLLNGPGEFKADNSKQVTVGKYTPYMPTSGKVEVEVVKADGSNKETVTKDYDKAGNIVQKMNDAGAMTGVEAVNMLRKYIDEAYGGYYKENRADLFIGQNAAWDADEMVALLRCVVANPQTLNGTDSIQGIFSREDENNQRRVDIYRLAAVLFGVRGLESRQDFLYIGNDKMVHDARQEEATYAALEKMNQMKEEGLFSQSFVNSEKITAKDNLIPDDTGFMSYDYNQTQTIYNEQEGKMDADEEYRAVMVPVAKWYDGSDSNGVYMRFTESWRSVKDSGWCIPKATESNTDVLNACLHLFDYAFSADGQILMSYGPDAFIKVKDANATKLEDKYETFEFNGMKMPVISEGCAKDLWEKGKGNYTDFARQYLGSTLHFVKSQAFEYQCTTEAGKKGAGYISKAIALGTIKHPELSISSSNPWYISVPTIFPVTAEDTAILNGLTEIGSAGYFNTAKKGTKSMLVDMMINGYNAENCPGKSAKEVADKVANDWKGKSYLEIKQLGWDDILKV